MIKLGWRIFKFSNNFFTYIKMSKDWSGKCYQNNKEKLQTKLMTDQNLSKEEREKSHNVVVNDEKIFQKMKIKSLLSIEKNIIKWEKTPYYNYKKLLF